MIDLPNDLRFILASASPRRLQLLRQVGLEPEVVPADIDEPPFTIGTPTSYAIDLAEQKTMVVAGQYPNALVVGADTIVVVDDHVLGKPVDAGEAQEMLGMLSGRWHEVFTAYCIYFSPSVRPEHGIQRTRVHFRELQGKEIRRYVDTSAPMDKAGAYGIQDGSALFVDGIEGDFYNVVGFPLTHFSQRLKAILSRPPTLDFPGRIS